ncbi:MAG TPA: hypothetical protein VHK91_15425 [Flavisolibacter sp.]|jgi:uncharacterized lipoprotein|nr:hypothetical protein [Flavisolibacter sp.]
MKKLVFLCVVVLSLAACSNDGSAKIQLDSLGKKFDSAAPKLLDSAKQGLKNLKNKIEEKLDRNDTVRQHDSL